MSTNKISLKFYGRDFSPIDADLQDEVELVNGRKLNKSEQINLLIKFIDHHKADLKKLILQTSNKSDEDKKTKDEKTKLYSIYNDKAYWGGIVGIFKGTLSKVYESDLRVLLDNETNTLYENIEITIQIQSRFDSYYQDNNKKIAKPYFLTTMLLKCQTGFNNNLVPNNSEDFFFDLLLLYLFKEKANKCYLKGLYKTYQRFEKNDDKVKGSIDVARHIKLNMGLENGKIAYSYRENTIDNYLNHLILCAFDILKKKYPETLWAVYLDYNNANFRFLIDSLKSNLLPLYDSRLLITKNLNPISHPFYTEYEELRKISLRILRNEGLSVFDGEAEEVNGILFYIPDLWESYLIDSLIDNRYTLHFQGYNNNPVMILDYEDDNTFVQKTYPDYVFSTKLEGQTELPFMILDAKFKPSWGEIIKKKSSFINVLEDYDKCLRDMISINAHACGTIFPTNEDIPFDNVYHNISEYNKIDKFYTFPIYVPKVSITNDNSYASWIHDFNEKNEQTITKIKKIISDEKEFIINNYKNLSKLNSLR